MKTFKEHELAGWSAKAGAYGDYFGMVTARIHLDEVRGLGSFMEIEVVLEDGEATAEGERVAEALLAELEIPAAALLAPAYIDLLERAGC